MGAMDIQFFCVADNRPVSRHLLSHHAEFNKGAELANHLQTLFDRRRVPGCLDVNFAAVPASEIEHFLNSVFLRWIKTDIGSAAFGDFQSVVTQVERDDSLWPFHLRTRHHPESKRTAARDHYGILIVYVSSFNRMQRAG